MHAIKLTAGKIVFVTFWGRGAKHKFGGMPLWLCACFKLDFTVMVIRTHAMHSVTLDNASDYRANSLTD